MGLKVRNQKLAMVPHTGADPKPKCENAALVWDVENSRMLLACDDGKLQVWSLLDNSWVPVAGAPGQNAPVAGVYNPSSQTVQFVSGTMRTTWELQGHSLTIAKHKSPMFPDRSDVSAAWDPARDRLIVTADHAGFTLEDGVWNEIDDDALLGVLAYNPGHGLLSMGLGEHVHLTKSGSTPVSLPVPVLDIVKAIASNDKHLFVLRSLPEKGEVVEIMEAKVIARSASIPNLWAGACQWHPQLGAVVLRTVERENFGAGAPSATMWRYEPGGTLSRLFDASETQVGKLVPEVKKPKRSRKTYESWQLIPGGSRQPDATTGPTVIGLQNPWPICNDCGSRMEHALSVRCGPGLTLRDHDGLAVFFCDGEDGMCESWEPLGPSNQVEFLSGNAKETGPCEGERRTLKRKATKEVQTFDDEDESTIMVDTKLGGQPQWIHEPRTVACPDCGQAMIFALQIGIEVREFGDAGRGYVLICPDEHTAATLWQG